MCRAKLQHLLCGIGTLASVFPTIEITSHRTYRPARTVQDAFKSDWAKLSGDMNKAISTVMGKRNGEK